MGKDREQLMKPIRDLYFLPLSNKMFRSNVSLRRFFGEKRMPPDECKSQQMSMAVELSLKLETALRKHLGEKSQDGFKVMLPAYIQSSVNNAVIDYIKNESHWERQTLPDSYGDGEEESPIEKTADDLSRAPEQVVLSKEKVLHLNGLRAKLGSLLKSAPAADLSLTVVDCLFGLGLTEYSTAGEEMTMRECCDKLKIEGETQARKIARCQVLLDKGLDNIRQVLRAEMPAIAQCWQMEINVNVASRRDLNHQLDLTEGEIQRLVMSRQYIQLSELVERLVVKPPRLPELIEKGAVAAFVPVDVNSATVRDLIDVLGLSKEIAQKLVSLRPFERLQQLGQRNLISDHEIGRLVERGAVLKMPTGADARSDLNQADQAALTSLGMESDKAARILRACPFGSWAEVEEFIGADESSWRIIRNNFRLGVKPA
jgi:DNA uptake protein ComE-like DNA-binding protein/Mn-dependent DtxR family transcriptional regulator